MSIEQVVTNIFLEPLLEVERLAPAPQPAPDINTVRISCSSAPATDSILIEVGGEVAEITQQRNGLDVTGSEVFVHAPAMRAFANTLSELATQMERAASDR